MVLLRKLELLRKGSIKGSTSTSISSLMGVSGEKMANGSLGIAPMGSYGGLSGS